MGVFIGGAVAQTNMTSVVKTTIQKEGYKLKLRTGTTIAGTVMIGTSFAAYAISNTSYSDRLSRANDKYTGELTTLADKKAMGVLTTAQYNIEVEKINTRMNDDISGIKNRQKTLNYVCAGASIAGIIVIVAGLHKEYTSNGIRVAENLYCDPLNNGVAFSITF